MMMMVQLPQRPLLIMAFTLLLLMTSSAQPSYDLGCLCTYNSSLPGLSNYTTSMCYNTNATADPPLTTCLALCNTTQNISTQFNCCSPLPECGCRGDDSCGSGWLAPYPTISGPPANCYNRGGEECVEFLGTCMGPFVMTAIQVTKPGCF